MDQTNTREQIKQLYEMYGFKTYHYETEFITFIYDFGYFKNAEIVKFTEKNLDEIKQELIELGYNPFETSFSEVTQLHNRLFEGFFQVDIYKEKVKKEYNSFRNNQGKVLAINYEYIKGSYYQGAELKRDDLINQILSEIQEEGPRLIVLEAAAGYGKTCSVYEIYNEIVNKSDINNIPLMSELSRNRKAKIFRYVLLDEIDKNFPTLKSELVESEIYNGRIPLIVDGFDELIIRSHNPMNAEMDSGFDDIESMLDTIGDMLKDNAKIILTSRKSALLSGDKFFEWINSRENDFKVSKYMLNEPSIKDWIGWDKLSIFNKLADNAEKLLNPVILAFIRSLSVEDFSKICSNIDELIENYFNRLLERERVRQNLILDTKEQMHIFQGLAHHMAELGITSDSRENIKYIISSTYMDIIEESRKRYLSSDRPDFESIANTLAGHVLLDRNGSFDRVGFINEFIFGILLGNSICSQERLDIIDMKFIDLACTSYNIRSQAKKDLLFDKFSGLSGVLLDHEKLEIDIKLKNALTSNYNYNNISFNGTVFDKFEFGQFQVQDTIFYACVFSKMSFKKTTFFRTSFIECKFYNCIFERDTEELCEIQFISNSSDTSGMEELTDTVLNPIDDSTEWSEAKYEKIVIEQFWPVGKAAGQPKRHYRTLFYGVEHKHHSYIEKAIERLKKRGILNRESDIYAMDYSKSSEIKEIRNGN